MKIHDRFRFLFLALMLAAGRAPAQTAVEEIVVTGDLDSLPGGYVESVFGFDKSLLETPRSASTISSALLERFDMQDIDELIVLAPGSFTQSFFGVAGGLDIRGTPGETYFRGMRRLDNPGNYPTPIGASDRIDVIRGPASPIYGPSKIGGYLNFNPKSARIEGTGAFPDRTSGAVSFSSGSWDKATLAAELGGPVRIGSRNLGYHLYTLIEDSGSYYDSGGQQQHLLQFSMDMDVSNSVRAQFGGMLHQYRGNQVAGWNRLTQDLIDNGRYVTGAPSPLDRDGDGYISHREFDVDGDGFTDLNPFAGGLVPGQGGRLEGANVCMIGATPVFGCVPGLLALENPGTAFIGGNTTLTVDDDTLENTVTTLYFDLLGGDASGWEWKNQLFFEHYDNLNENAYGFSQFHDTWVVENKLVFSRRFRFDDMTADLQLSPSLRHTDFEHGDDYTNEYFDRRDLTRPLDALADRLLATRVDDDYTEYYIGDYTDFGLAALLDLSFDNGFSALIGLRHDSIAMASRQPVDKLLLPSSNNFCLPPGDCVVSAAEDDVGGVSWTLSLSRQLDNGLLPYLTVSRQSTLIAGQGAELSTNNIRDGGAFDQSELLEAGVKGSLLDNRLYFAAATYRQERTDFSAQAIVTNQASRTRGVEFETRWSVNESLLLAFGYSRIEVVNLNTQEAGSRFSFIGADDLPDIEPWRLYGGALGGVVISGDARRAGMPENIYSLTGTWDFGNGWTLNGSVADVEAVYSGYSRRVLLPAYTLANLGFGFEARDWLLSFNLKNIAGERYFRANFPNLFGGVIAFFCPNCRAISTRAFAIAFETGRNYGAALFELIAKPLFRLPAETSHGIALGVLDRLHRLGLSGLLAADGGAPARPLRLMGLEFPHRIGLAAGLDKNGDHIDALAALGFAFLEIGTLTPRPQPGNPRPRLFRDRNARCIVNRMGFNNKGIAHAVARLERRRSEIVVGVNVGKNRDTPVERADEDYLECLRQCREVADYVAVNISSPNTLGLRELQFGARLERLLEALKQAQAEYEAESGRYLPIALKLAPDLDEGGIRRICAALLAWRVDCVIAANTTLSRPAALPGRIARESGGLSGAPLTGLARETVRAIKAEVGDAIPIIGVGGIMSGEDGREMLAAGADLLQIYSGIIFRGPGLIGELAVASGDRRLGA